MHRGPFPTALAANLPEPDWSRYSVTPGFDETRGRAFLTVVCREHGAMSSEEGDSTFVLGEMPTLMALARKHESERHGEG